MEKIKKIKIKGILKYWVYKCFLVIITILVITGIIIFIATEQYFYELIYPFAKKFYDRFLSGVIIPASTKSFLTLITIFIIIILELIMAFFIAFSNYKFIKSIIKPIENINIIAKKVAEGKFDIKIKKERNDEIGELCDTINYMTKELANSEKMKNDFIASISHELRTPLTAIKGWAETIELNFDSKNFNDDITKKGTKVIVQESERLCKIIEELLEFSNIKNNKLTFLMEKIDILAELSEAVHVFEDRANNEKKQILYAEPVGISSIIGDKNKLRQVFINVIDNALKYTEEKGTISISVEEINDKINIIISDTGCGIPEKDLPKVKEKFYKANMTRGGSGIGLAIADEIISVHSGTLEISSKENVGTIVKISLNIEQGNLYDIKRDLPEN